MQLVKEIRQDELLRLLLSGYKPREAAVYLKVSTWTVYKYCRDPEFMAELRAKNADMWALVDAEINQTKLGIVQRAEEGAREALEEMINLAKGGLAETTRLRACQDLLDRNPEISRTKRLEGSADPSRSNVLNAVFLKQAFTVMVEEDKKKGLSVGGGGEIFDVKGEEFVASPKDSKSTTPPSNPPSVPSTPPGAGEPRPFFIEPPPPPPSDPRRTPRLGGPPSERAQLIARNAPQVQKSLFAEGEL